MSKYDKLLETFLQIPPPKDFTWSDLLTLMRGFGFEWKNPKGGSHGFFLNAEKGLIIKPAVRPHPQNTLKIYQIRLIKEKLFELKLIRAQNDKSLL